MIRVLIADDSELTRIVLRDLLAQDANITVVCEVSDGRSAVEQTLLLQPDLIIMDVMMPVMDGLEAVAEIMASRPTPILMLSANTDPQDSRSAFAAIRLGALDVMAKPSGVATSSFAAIAAQLIAKIKSLSRIRVIHHHRPHRPKFEPAPIVKPPGPRRILAIGASTGGPRAVMQILQHLPRSLNAAVLVVQHIAEGFAPGFAEWLDREVPMPVHLAEAGNDLRAGQVQIAPNGRHMVVRSGRIILEDAPPQNNCRPAVDALFRSLADQGLAAETVAVLLTGMGSDGAAGLEALYSKGAYTLAQDEASCAVFGMPKAAIDRGAVTQVVPLIQMPETLGRLFAC